jgi:hypothetical protein
MAIYTLKIGQLYACLHDRSSALRIGVILQQIKKKPEYWGRMSTLDADAPTLVHSLHSGALPGHDNNMMQVQITANAGHFADICGKLAPTMKPKDTSLDP